MIKKAKPNVKTQGAVTFELLHQPNFKRTILLLYLQVPANYIVRFKNKETSPLKSEDEKKASDELFSEISKNRQLGASKDKLEKIKKQHLKKWESDHPGENQHLSSYFTFCVYDSPGSGAHLQDFKFLLPDADHDVRLSIRKCTKSIPKAEKDSVTLKELIKEIQIPKQNSRLIHKKS